MPRSSFDMAQTGAADVNTTVFSKFGYARAIISCLLAADVIEERLVEIANTSITIRRRDHGQPVGRCHAIFKLSVCGQLLHLHVQMHTRKTSNAKGMYVLLTVWRVSSNKA